MNDEQNKGKENRVGLMRVSVEVGKYLAPALVAAAAAPTNETALAIGAAGAGVMALVDIVRVLTHKDKPLPPAKAVPTEAERLQRLRDQQIEDRNANSRSRVGSGAESATPPKLTVGQANADHPNIPNITAPSSEGTGKSPFTLVAEENKLPTRDNTDDRGPL